LSSEAVTLLGRDVKRIGDLNHVKISLKPQLHNKNTTPKKERCLDKNQTLMKIYKITANRPKEYQLFYFLLDKFITFPDNLRLD